MFPKSGKLGTSTLGSGARTPKSKSCENKSSTAPETEWSGINSAEKMSLLNRAGVSEFVPSNKPTVR